MQDSGQQQNNNGGMPPIPCVGGCGFFGHPVNQNYCSKCYMEKKSEEARSLPPPTSASPATTPAITPASCCEMESHTDSGSPTAKCSPELLPSISENLPLSSSTTIHDTEENREIALRFAAQRSRNDITVGLSITKKIEKPSKSRIQKNTSRCWSCRKKIGLLGFKCRCGYTFCSFHRYNDRHDCSFDFKTSERNLLRDQNQKTVRPKLEKI